MPGGVYQRVARGPCVPKVLVCPLRLGPSPAVWDLATSGRFAPLPMASPAPSDKNLAKAGSPSGSLAKFGAPPGGTGTDAAKALKLAAKVEVTLKRCLNQTPGQLDPNLLLVAPENRNGTPPNVRYIYEVLLKSLGGNGFDPTRPAVGICVQYQTPEGKARLLEWNRRFTLGNPQMPYIDEDRAMYGTLAGTHLNIALRILQAGLADATSVAPRGSALAEVVTHGHSWWILPEDTPRPSLIELSLWRNQDQNENQAMHEIEILRNLMSVCGELKQSRTQISLGDLCAFAEKRSPAKVAARALESLAKFYLGYLKEEAKHLADELVDFHAARVNPRELCVSAGFFQSLAVEAGFLRAPLVRHYVLLTQYTKEKSKTAAGSPDHAAFLEHSVLASLAKKPDMVRLLEQMTREARAQYLPILEQQVSLTQARLEVADLGILWCRCLLAKPLQAPYKGVTGKFGKEKGRELANMWALRINEKYPDLQFLQKSGHAENIEVPEDHKEMVPLNAQDNEEGLSQEDIAIGRIFQAGDEVIVRRRFTWKVPFKSVPDYRKDIPEGTSGIVRGFADPQLRNVLLEVDIKVPGPRGTKVKTVTQSTSARNLVLKSEYEAEKHDADIKAAAAHEDPSDEDASRNPRKPAPLVPKAYAWLHEGLEEEQRTKIFIESRWDKLEDSKGVLQALAALRGKVAVGMQAALEALPTFGPADLLIVHREQPSGSYTSEVWTLRKFAAGELVVPLISTEMKSGLWSKGLSALVNLPAHGEGKHPQGKDLAIDGRGRQKLWSAGTVELEERKGCLCWLLERTTDYDEANLKLETLTWSLSVHLQIPAAKKQKTSLQWPSETLPGLPVVVNPKAIKEKTRLRVFLDPSDSKAKGSASKK